MKRLSALELMFLGMESESRPMHSGGLLVFEPTADRSPRDLADQLFSALRTAVPVAPWNRRPVFGLGMPAWKTVSEVDLEYHVQRVALPAPGSVDQLMTLVSNLYPPLLDRSRPMWTAYLIEGLEGGRMALCLKVHHALADGVGGLRMLHGSFSDSPNDTPQPIWAVPTPDRPKKADDNGNSIFGAVKQLPGLWSGAVKVLPESLRLVANTDGWLFRAARTPWMGAKVSPARSFAWFELPLEDVIRVGRQFGGTVTDVLLSVCDAAMQRLVEEHGGTPSERMTSFLAVSTRKAGDESSSNAVGGMIVRLGAAEAAPAQRLTEVVAGTSRGKALLRASSHATLQLQLLSATSAMELREQLPVGRGLVPLIANFTVSNIPGGPREKRYLGRAQLASVYVVPIVPSGQEANFTAIACGDKLCVGIGAAHTVIPDTPRLAQLASDGFQELLADASTRR